MTDVGGLEQFRAAEGDSQEHTEDLHAVRDIQGRGVLSAHAMVSAPGWLVFVELPLSEAYAAPR